MSLKSVLLAPGLDLSNPAQVDAAFDNALAAASAIEEQHAAEPAEAVESGAPTAPATPAEQEGDAAVQAVAAEGGQAEAVSAQPEAAESADDAQPEASELESLRAQLEAARAELEGMRGDKVAGEQAAARAKIEADRKAVLDAMVEAYGEDSPLVAAEKLRHAELDRIAAAAGQARQPETDKADDSKDAERRHSIAVRQTPFLKSVLESNDKPMLGMANDISNEILAAKAGTPEGTPLTPEHYLAVEAALLRYFPGERAKFYPSKSLPSKAHPKVTTLRAVAGGTSPPTDAPVPMSMKEMALAAIANPYMDLDMALAKAQRR